VNLFLNRHPEEWWVAWTIPVGNGEILNAGLEFTRPLSET
jgi:hypothetical protein